MDVSIALLGAGFMGSAHARAYTSIPRLYGSGIIPRIAWVVNADAGLAERAARDWGAQRWGTDWREAIADPSVPSPTCAFPLPFIWTSSPPQQKRAARSTAKSR